MLKRFASNKPKREEKKEDLEELELNVDLATLIQNRRWRTLLARLSHNPLEAEQDLNVMTRGGFVAASGFTPLHYVCERRPPVEVVNALLEAFPTAVMTRTMPGGCLPLHVACTWYATSEVVAALLTADQGGASVTDELGNVALHSACFSGADESVIFSLLAAQPKAVLSRNKQGSRPIDICKRLRHANRRSVMHLLTLKKDELLHRHRRSASSGTWSDAALEAAELNERYVIVWNEMLMLAVSFFCATSSLTFLFTVPELGSRRSPSQSFHKLSIEIPTNCRKSTGLVWKSRTVRVVIVTMIPNSCGYDKMHWLSIKTQKLRSLASAMRVFDFRSIFSRSSLSKPNLPSEGVFAESNTILLRRAKLLSFSDPWCPAMKHFTKIIAISSGVDQQLDLALNALLFSGCAVLITL